jgi:hypothetical protein
MKITITKLLSSLAIIVFAFSVGVTKAQTVIYQQNFDDTVTVAGPTGGRIIKLPSDWTTNTTDSTWVPDSAKATTDALTNSSKHNAMFLETNPVNAHPAHQHGQVILTFAGISVKNYKNISVNWTERFSGKFPIGGDTVFVEYSVDNGKNWDTIPHLKTIGGAFNWTNGGVAPVLPSKADHATKLMVRFRAHVTGSGGNYQFDDFSISGTLNTGIEEAGNLYSKLPAYYAEGMLNLDLRNSTGRSNIYVFNTSGQVVMNTSANQNEVATLNVGSLCPGLYIVRAINEGNSYTYRFVK